MSEQYLTMAEIEAKYPNHWVLLANPKLTRYQEVAGGVVVVHSPDRAEYLRLVGEWDDPAVKHIASWYTGWGVGREPVDDIEPAEPEPGVA
jgi:hypothetical protein